MNVLITGGTGLIGKKLVQKLRERNHNARVLTREKTNNPDEFYWNTEEKVIDSKAFENLDSIIHLAGANISQKWTASYKKEMFSSRIDSAIFRTGKRSSFRPARRLISDWMGVHLFSERDAILQKMMRFRSEISVRTKCDFLTR